MDVLYTDAEIFNGAHFGVGGDIHLENVQCEGSESRLEDCPMSGVECDHSQVTGVSCQGILEGNFRIAIPGTCYSSFVLTPCFYNVVQQRTAQQEV